MSASNYMRIQEKAILEAKDGRKIEVPQKVFDRLWEAIHERKYVSDTVTLEIKNGGIAGASAGERLF